MTTFLTGYPTAGKTTLLNHLQEQDTYPCFPEYVSTDEAMPSYPQSESELQENIAFVLRVEQKRMRDVGDDKSAIVDTPPSTSLVFLKIISQIINCPIFPEVLNDFVAAIQNREVLVPNRIVLLNVDFPTVIQRWQATRDPDPLWTDLRVYREFTRFNRYLADNLPSLHVDAANTSPSELVDVLHEHMPTPAEQSPSKHAHLLETYDWASNADQFDERDDVLLDSRGASVNPYSDE